MVKYAELADVEIRPVGHPGCFPHGQGADGYGRKITSPYIVKIKDSRRWRRVYITIFSNIGSLWIVVNKEQRHIHDYEIEELLAKKAEPKKPPEKLIDPISGKPYTDPYKECNYAIGGGDVFHCFDFYVLDDGRFILHAVVCTEEGPTVQDADYRIVDPHEAPAIAQGMVDAAVAWMRDNGVEHDGVGWGQEVNYFSRAVCVEAFPKEFTFVNDSVLRTGGDYIDKLCQAVTKSFDALSECTLLEGAKCKTSTKS